MENDDQEDTRRDEFGRANDPQYNPSLVPASDACQHIVDEAIRQYTSYEKYKDLRRRKRTVKQERLHKAAVTSLICNAIQRHLSEPRGAFRITRSKSQLGNRDRYRPDFVTEKLVDIMDVLATPDIAWLNLAKGTRQKVCDENLNWENIGTATRLTAGPSLVGCMEASSLSLSDIKMASCSEVIILRSSKALIANGFTHKRTDLGGAEPSGRNLNYTDTRQTGAMRKKMETINACLAKADLSTLPDAETAFDTSRRELVRIFNNGSFTQGGRLYRGFWLEMPTDDRRNTLRIKGEAIAELDYGQMFLRLAYAHHGLQAPLGDLYAVQGCDARREGIKVVMNAALFATKPLSRFPRGAKEFFGNHETIESVMRAITTHHHPIEDLLFIGFGYKAMRHEGDIMVEVLLRAAREGLTVLPLHDGVLTPLSNTKEIMEVMVDVFHDETGTVGVVTQDWPLLHHTKPIPKAETYQYHQQPHPM